MRSSIKAEILISRVGIRTLPDPKDSDFVLTTETIADLSPDSPESVRIKTMRDLTPIVKYGSKIRNCHLIQRPRANLLAPRHTAVVFTEGCQLLLGLKKNFVLESQLTKYN